MRFINNNLNVIAISLRSVNGAGSMVLRSYQSLELRLERICTGLFRAPNQGQLWPVIATSGVQCAGIQHQPMFTPAIGDEFRRSFGTTATSGKPATTICLGQARLGLS